MLRRTESIGVYRTPSRLLDLPYAPRPPTYSFDDKASAPALHLQIPHLERMIARITINNTIPFDAPRRHCICHSTELALRRHVTRFWRNEWRADARTKQKEDTSKKSCFGEEHQRQAFSLFSSLCTAAMNQMMMERGGVVAEGDDSIAEDSLTYGSEASGRRLGSGKRGQVQGKG